MKSTSRRDLDPLPMSPSRTEPREGGASFSLSNRITRGVWILTWMLLASWTPPFLFRWRRFLLVCFGAKMAPLSDVRSSARVWHPANLVMGHRAVIGPRVNCYNMAPVTLEEYALVSQGAHLCAGNHDMDDKAFALFAKPITLRAHSWVAADAFVGPGVTLQEGAVLGARGVAFQDLSRWTIYVGNPATPRRPRTNFLRTRANAESLQ